MIGESLAHYKIVEKLGEGGMGEVYLAEDLKLKRRVALKVLPREGSSAPAQLERFQREAEAIAALSHPNIVTIHSVEQVTSPSGESVHFLTMELVEGKTLEQIVPAGGLPQKKLYDVAVQIADALAAAHAKGITHRDLKPTNIMVGDDGRVVVLDFGLAKLAERDPSLMVTQAPTQAVTREGTILGTYPYMSPEQAEGRPLDARTDIFSFGVILYQLATGVRPFQGDTSAALISSILKDEAVSVEELNTALPRQLGRIVSHCLEKERNRRFQSALDVRNELAALRREVESHEASVAIQASSVSQAPAPESRHRLMLVVAAILAIVAVGMFLVPRFASRPETPDQAPISREASQPTVAVFPFQNLTADPAFDYLELAVPDEVTTALSRAPGLAVRPFTTTASYSAEVFDPGAAGKAVGAANLVTGQYFAEGERLQMTLEAIDAETNQLFWRESVSGTTGDLIALRALVAERVREELVPKLGAVDVSGGGTVPSNEQAYNLYLRGLAQGTDIDPNRRAIAMLEQAVELDPSYAPAWNELAARYYYEGNYGLAGSEMYDAAIEAAQRALALDPSLVGSAMRIITIQAETGQLEEAWDEASRLLERHPESADLHHAMGYVLRYAGLVDEALLECERALEIDSTNPRFRSCGITAYLVGAYDRSEVFLQLDGTTHMYVSNITMLRVRQGRPLDGLSILRSERSGLWHLRYLELCLADEAPDERESLAQRIEPEVFRQLDGEQLYWTAAYMSYCGEPERAARLLKGAVERGYCSYPLIETDPLLEPVRDSGGYAELRSEARACHERFLTHRAARAAQP